jgi:hypothetical protein
MPGRGCLGGGMATKALAAETLKKKALAFETLPEFLARMTLVWQDRQLRVALAAERAREASRRHADKAKAADPEGFAARRREAVRRCKAKNRAAILERERRNRARLAPALAVARELVRLEKRLQKQADLERKKAAADAKRGKRREGYPSVRQTQYVGGAVNSAAVPSSPFDALTRALSSPSSSACSRPENRGSSAL